MSRWLWLEPYYDGSHRHLADGLVERLAGSLELWTLPARKWKWRMRGAAVSFAERASEVSWPIDGIVCTSMCNAAELRGLLPAALRTVPIVLYFHENQLAYPTQEFDRRDHHFAWTHLNGALAADVVLWNSVYNRDSFAVEMERVVRKMPDARPIDAVSKVLAKSHVFPVPLDIQSLKARRAPRSGPAHIVWNHRWEFDKGPQRLLDCVRHLNTTGLDYRLSILGQSFDVVPPEFEALREEVGDRMLAFGRIEDRDAYLRHLSTADVALSTAHHEFQGLAVIEAAACGAVPLVPDDLAYRDIWPTRFRVPASALATALAERVAEPSHWREVDPIASCEPFDWSVQLPRWRELLSI